jgi:oxygen-independent coproporphyrinogen-3 oxidase
MPPAGLYLHIPFCQRKCPYCDFYSETTTDGMAGFVAGLQREITLRAEPGLAVDTVYFGGGTPSLCPPDALAELLGHIRTCFRLQEGAEITLEANPGAISSDDLVRLRSIGVNRLNIGVQSFRDDALQFLGRIHTPDEAVDVLHKARAAGFANLGFDLIYGLPGQSPAEWRSDLAQATAFGPEHISCYILTYEPGTPMTMDYERGRVRPLEEDRVADLFDITADVLVDRGYEHYEISNFARTPGYRSRHNLKYWRFAPYLGFGPSAHSYREGTRWWNLADVDLYCRRLARGRLPEAGRESLSREQEMLEALLLGLRMKEGFAIAAFEGRFRISVRATFGRLLNQLAEEGCLAEVPGRCALSPKGMRYHDSIAARFAAEL